MEPDAPAASFETSPTAGAHRRPGWIGCVLALIAAGLATYWNSFPAPLVLDDLASIAENPSIRTLWPISTALSPPANVGLGGRPVANVSFALNYAWSGTAVGSYHAINLAIHLGAALVLFGLMRRTCAAPAMRTFVPASAALPVAFATALLWLVHPLQTEAVTYLSQRTESLMGFFYLLTLYSFARAASGGHRLWFIVAALACAAGMATKEVMVTAPLMVLLYDRTFLSGSFRAAWERHKGIYVGLAASWLLLAFLLVDVHERGVGYKAVTWWDYALTESRAILHYFRLALWPHPLVFDYGTEITRSFAGVWFHVSIIWLLLATTAVAVWRWPVTGFAGAWVFIALAPTSSVVPLAGQPMAEHRMYLPLVAIVAGVAVLLHRRFGTKAFLGIAASAAVLAGYATVDRNRDYRSALALWTDTAAKMPHNARAHAGVGAALLEQGNVAAAIPSLQRALRLNPLLAEAHNNLATALIDAGRPEESVAHFTASLQLQPATASTYYNLGNVLLQLGRTSDAIVQQRRALSLQRNFPEAECALANALAASGAVADSLPHYEAALRLQPELAAAHLGLANALANVGRTAEAVTHYQAVLRAVPQSVEAHFNLGNVFFALRRMPEAVEHYDAALRLKPDLADAHNNAGNALAMSGKYAAAIARYEAALRLRPDFPTARANLEALRKAGGERN